MARQHQRGDSTAPRGMLFATTGGRGRGSGGVIALTNGEGRVGRVPAARLHTKARPGGNKVQARRRPASPAQVAVQLQGGGRRAPVSSSPSWLCRACARRQGAYALLAAYCRGGNRRGTGQTGVPGCCSRAPRQQVQGWLLQQSARPNPQLAHSEQTCAAGRHLPLRNRQQPSTPVPA